MRIAFIHIYIITCLPLIILKVETFRESTKYFFFSFVEFRACEKKLIIYMVANVSAYPSCSEQRKREYFLFATAKRIDVEASLLVAETCNVFSV